MWFKHSKNFTTHSCTPSIQDLYSHIFKKIVLYHFVLHALKMAILKCFGVKMPRPLETNLAFSYQCMMESLIQLYQKGKGQKWMSAFKHSLFQYRQAKIMFNPYRTKAFFPQKTLQSCHYQKAARKSKFEVKFMTFNCQIL